MTRARRAAQRGFTLVEIMIALVISTLVVAMIIGIFTSMSAAYRTQQQVAELQQILQAANATVEADLRQAGFGCSQGFFWAGAPTVVQPALNVVDGGSTAQQPDQLTVFYGDPSKQARIMAWTPTASTTGVTALTVDAIDATWQVGDLALISIEYNANTFTPEWEYAPNYQAPEESLNGDLTNDGAKIPQFASCVVQISALTNTTVTFSASGTYGNAGNTQCATAASQFNLGSIRPMLYHFVGHSYRIDPTRKNLSVFQQSPSGGLIANDWTDLGLGFTNFQIASRWFEIKPGTDNADTDTDPRRNWYSDNEQATEAAASTIGTTTKSMDQITAALQVSVSFVVRTTRPVTDGTVTAATPLLEVTSNVNYNDIGNSPSVTMAGVAQATLPTELQGNNIYRYSTIKIDTRNLGYGR